jgi:hypothetical protein
MATACSEAAGDEALHRAVRGPYQLGSAATTRCRWSSSVVAAWLAGQRSSAVAGDGEARRGRRCSCGGAAAATGRHGGGGGARAVARAAATRSDALGQRGVVASDRGARTRGAFMARRDSSAAPGSQSGCSAWRLGH